MSDFEKEFLENYLKFGLGSMPKSDIDALVMYLLDKYGYLGTDPLSKLRNQDISERLKTPVSKVKSLRYSAALKFGESVEDQAKGRLLAALSNATLEDDKESEIDSFKLNYGEAKKKSTAEARKRAFKSAAKKFAESAAKQAGVGVVAVLKAHMEIV